MHRGGGGRAQLRADQRGSRRDTGFHLVDEIGREARAVAGISSLTAQLLRGALDHPPGHRSAPPRPRCRTGWRSTSRAPAASSSAAPKTNLGDAIRKLDSRSARPTRASRAGSVALEQVRLPLYDVHWTPAVVVEKRSIPGRPNRSASACATAACCRSRPGAAGPASRINLNDVVYVKVVESPGQKGRAPASSCAPGRRCRAWRVVLENKTGRDAGDGRRLLLSAEPAQPRHAIAPPAGLLAQAADLSLGADPRPAAQHADPGRADHLSADRRRQPLHARRPTGGRRATTTAAMPAR